MMTPISPVTFSLAKPVILRSEPEVKAEEACHRAERGSFLTAAGKMLVLKADGAYLLSLSLSPSVSGGRHLADAAVKNDRLHQSLEVLAEAWRGIEKRPPA